MRRRFRHAAVLIALAGSTATLEAQNGEYADPDASATRHAAVRALPGKRLPIVGKQIAIVGVTRGIDAVLEDLNAKVTAQEIRIDLAADVLFDFDKADIKPAAAGELGKVAQVLQAHPGAPLAIAGHTDSKGSDSYNVTLSERRAEAVKAWLVANAGVAAAQVSTSGWGEGKPVAPNENADGSDNPEGRQRNRRVEITVRTGGG